MRLIDADALLEILKREEVYLRKNQADERADGILDAIMDTEDAYTIEPKAYDEIVKIIADSSFTGGDGLDYVETLVALNAIRGMKRDTGEWIPYTYVDPDDWYQDKETRYYCSKCGVKVINKSNFCPNCGKDMRKKGGRKNE